MLYIFRSLHIKSAVKHLGARQEVGRRPQEVVFYLICIILLSSLCSCTSTRTKMANSYDLGQSDATKELYWSKVRMQQEQSQKSINPPLAPAQPNVTMYPIVHPAHIENGINYKAYTDYIPVTDSNNK